MRRALLAVIALWFLLLPGSTRTVRLRESVHLHVPAVLDPTERIASCAGTKIGTRCFTEGICPADALWMEGMCVPFAREHDDVPSGVDLVTNEHVERSGRMVTYEHVPRRPDVPAAYDLYQYPVTPWHGTTVTSGYDLDSPDNRQRRGSDLAAVGHGGVDLPHDRGTPVQVVDLRGQVGDAEVLFVGTLFGTTVLLQQNVREDGQRRTYVVLHGHLEASAPGIARGMTVPAGTVIGFVGDTGAPGIVHLHYEVRLARAHVDPHTVDPPTMLVAQQNTVPCDPRNVLPLRNHSP